MFRGVREDAAAFAQHLRVEVDEGRPEADVALGVVEVAVFGAAELVGRAVLMDQPRHLVRVPHEIRRKLRPDDEVDRPAVAFRQVEQPPGGGVREDFLLRIPLEGQRDALDEVAARPELGHQAAHVNLGAAVHERHLGLADDHRADARSAARGASGGVPEVDHVAVGDDVFLALEPQLAVIPAGRQRTARDERIVCHDLGPDESARRCRSEFRRRRPARWSPAGSTRRGTRPRRR